MENFERIMKYTKLEVQNRPKIRQLLASLDNSSTIVDEGNRVYQLLTYNCFLHACEGHLYFVVFFIDVVSFSVAFRAIDSKRKERLYNTLC